MDLVISSIFRYVSSIYAVLNISFVDQKSYICDCLNYYFCKSGFYVKLM